MDTPGQGTPYSILLTAHDATSKLSHVWHERQIAGVAQAVLEGREPDITGREASGTVAIAQGLYQPARLARPVSIKRL